MLSLFFWWCDFSNFSNGGFVMSIITNYIALVLANMPNTQLDVKQTTCMATVIYSEARGEPNMGKAAVAYTVLNRVRSKRYPDTICGVVYQKHQFTDVQFSKPDKSSEAWKISAEIAAYSQVRLIDDETNGGTMFFNPAKASPSWDFTKLELVGSIGGHAFFKEL